MFNQKEAVRMQQREPIRRPLAGTAAFFVGGGILLSITIIGAIIGIPMVVMGLIILLIRARIKTKIVPCPHCTTPVKVELKVNRFNCPQCSKTLYSQGDAWTAV